MTDSNHPQGAQRDPDDHWLVRESTIRSLWWGGSLVLFLTVLAQALIPIKGYFGVDNWPVFGAVFGFFSCVAMVAVAKLLGVFLKRDEAYYEEDSGD